MKDKITIEKITKISIIVIAVITLAIIVILNMKYEVTITRYEEHTNIEKMNIITLISSLLITIIMIFATNKITKLNINKNIKRVILLISLIIYTVFQIVWIQNCIIKAGADSEMVYGAAKRLYNNEGTSKLMLEYFGYYKQNISLIFIFEKIMQIFQNDSLNLLRYVNVFFNIFMVIGLYNIYKIVTQQKKRNGLLFYILILGFLPISFLCTWIYGDFIGLSLSVWSIFFMIKFVKSKKIFYFILSCIGMAISIMVRSNSLIFVVAIVIYLLFTLKDELKNKEKLIRLLMICIFILVSIVPNKIIISYVSNEWNLNDKKEKSSLTYIYMGMSEGKMANGWYNDEVNHINEEMKKRDKEDMTIENETKKKLKNRVSFLLEHPFYTYRFYRDKVLSMWAEPTMESEIYNTQRKIESSDNKLFVKLMEGNTFEFIKLSQKMLDITIYVGALAYVILKRKKISNEMLLLIIIFLGGFAFHMIWEAKSRYIIPYVVILIPVAVNGLVEVMEKIGEQIKKKRNKEQKIKRLKLGERKT